MGVVLNKFRELGYTVQEPTKDKTLYLVRQTSEYTKQIFVEVKKKKVKVYVYNIVGPIKMDGILTTMETEVLLEYVEELGYSEYEIIKDRV